MNKTMRLLTLSQTVIFLLFLALTVGNEILDIPYYVFNDTPTMYSQRYGEIIIELMIFLTVMAIQIVVYRNLYRRIRILEGFIPICAKCKKIRKTEDQWEQIEKYITQHSLARFSHSICPECMRELYPEMNIE